jgi:hypothetical protein
MSKLEGGNEIFDGFLGGIPVNQLSLSESLSFEEYDEYGELESKLT